MNNIWVMDRTSPGLIHVYNSTFSNQLFTTEDLQKKQLLGTSEPVLLKSGNL
ncbi:hypothetical protein F7734_58700 [Scytonema sp. UIC 10036]|uniref:hypothetical protein n=1 Tax=Scytonema sp. UIC 10036 TaxID=2304196 RepID=UPI0012DAECD9|nr:hypothetical protein [Scytonema sp. UIC 10036]MUH01577.1 hypothetical protein [Scytonema sp. UIC 10036]